MFEGYFEERPAKIVDAVEYMTERIARCKDFEEERPILGFLKDYVG